MKNKSIVELVRLEFKHLLGKVETLTEIVVKLCTNEGRNLESLAKLHLKVNENRAKLDHIITTWDAPEAE